MIALLGRFRDLNVQNGSGSKSHAGIVGLNVSVRIQKSTPASELQGKTLALNNCPRQ